MRPRGSLPVLERRCVGAAAAAGAGHGFHPVPAERGIGPGMGEECGPQAPALLGRCGEPIAPARQHEVERARQLVAHRRRERERAAGAADLDAETVLGCGHVLAHGGPSLQVRAVPAHGAQPATGQGELSFAKNESTFGERLRAGLRRRLAPNTGLHPKQLAAAIGVTDRAMQKILAGDSDGQGGTVAAMVEFFVGRGDAALLYELYAVPPLIFLKDHRNAIERVRREVRALKRWLDGAGKQAA
jgi:hypothetical protein